MTVSRARLAAGAAVLASLLAACEPGTKDVVQTGYRGVGQEQYYDRSEHARLASALRAPDPLPPAGPSPAARWQNVQVLTDISATEFTRTMAAMTQWVSPKEGCNYCHNPANYASDEKYAKVVSRRMLQMNRDINSNWRSHVAQTGVTCYSCHAGNPVPQQGLWYLTDRNQYLRYYLDRNDVRVQTTAALPVDNHASIKQAEYTYALMINMSRGLGVNCTYCHNSRSWSTWQNAPPTRVTALYGSRMVRALNQNYIADLARVLPANRLGPHGDAPKVQCATCHQGAFKPLYGAQMAKDYPALWGHPGPWNAALPSDSARNGITDLRDADSVTTDAAPRLPPAVAKPAPPPPRAAATRSAAATHAAPHASPHGAPGAARVAAGGTQP
jgi:photosynthetic reaction center cytochrome c subunit